jgi:MerR family transcriptional regulator, light-induced transcriptional regulator
MVERHRPDVVALSVTIAEHLPALHAIVAALRQSRVGRDAIVLCGGYPFRASPRLHEAYGADGTASDAQRALELAETLLAERNR